MSRSCLLILHLFSRVLGLLSTTSPRSCSCIITLEVGLDVEVDEEEEEGDRNGLGHPCSTNVSSTVPSCRIVLVELHACKEQTSDELYDLA